MKKYNGDEQWFDFINNRVGDGLSELIYNVDGDKGNGKFELKLKKYFTKNKMTVGDINSYNKKAEDFFSFVDKQVALIKKTKKATTIKESYFNY